MPSYGIFTKQIQWMRAKDDEVCAPGLSAAMYLDEQSGSDEFGVFEYLLLFLT